ncbi:MAG: SET domain-containing protein-lysine N-methyltransferase [Gemmatimonadaceae bacterium]|nr:SET domain-containing protein-lysine N-methyltransferase [Gemmatimonadaceae bacterium]
MDFAVGHRGDLGQRCVRILVDRPAGTVLVSFADSPRLAEPSYLTVQLDADTHIRPSPAFLECVNHSCTPNVAFDMEQLALVAVRDLGAGDELVYFYPSTEWQMAQAFTCACGAAGCLGVIDGASHLSEALLAPYTLSPFIRAQLAIRAP